MNGRKLYLSNTDRKLAGVCGGIAEFLGSIQRSSVFCGFYAVCFLAAAFWPISSAGSSFPSRLPGDFRANAERGVPGVCAVSQGA